MSKRVSKIRRPSISNPLEEVPRTFHQEVIGGTRLFVKNGYHAVPCTGEAHGNAHIDGCMGCLHHTWGWVAERDEAVSDAQLRDLATEAVNAGDTAMVTLANAALEGNKTARAECVRVIGRARAQLP